MDALAERDFAEGSFEAPLEAERDPLRDGKTAVGLDANLDVRGRERERLRGRPRDERERAQARGRDDCRAAQNWTCGASRAGSSISKNSLGAKRKMPAITFVGTVCVALLYVRTVSL